MHLHTTYYYIYRLYIIPSRNDIIIACNIQTDLSLYCYIITYIIVYTINRRTCAICYHSRSDGHNIIREFVPVDTYV